MKRIIYRIFDRYLRKKAIENHRKMWRWLAEHSDKRKFEYLELHDPEKEIYNNCYLCDYARKKSKNETGIAFYFCWYCPLDWNGKDCTISDSLFDKWCKCGFENPGQIIKERAEIARQIAELPERKDR